MNEGVRQAGYAQPQVPAAPPRAAAGRTAPDGGFDDTLRALDASRQGPQRAGRDGHDLPRIVPAAEAAPDDQAAASDADFLARLFRLGVEAVRGKGGQAGEADGKASQKAAGAKDGEAEDAAEKKKEAGGAAGVAATPVILPAVSGGPAAAAKAGSAAAAVQTATAAGGGDAGAGQLAAKKDAAGATPEMPAGGERTSGGKAAAAHAHDPAAHGHAGTDPDARKPDAGSDRPGTADGAAARVKLISVHSTPAPAAPVMGPTTAASLAGALHAEAASLAQGAQAAMPMHGETVPGAATLHTIRIQLQPAALGMVTAKLRLSGDSLQVELQADNADAHHRLRSDSDAIVKSLRALGYDVDRVTVQPPPHAQGAGNHNATAAGRDQSFQQQATGRNGGEGFGGTGHGRGQDGDTSHFGAERQEQGISAGDGLFI